jgi:hypothetical protein
MQGTYDGSRERPVSEDHPLFEATSRYSTLVTLLRRGQNADGFEDFFGGDGLAQGLNARHDVGKTDAFGGADPFQLEALRKRGGRTLLTRGGQGAAYGGDETKAIRVQLV